MNGLRTNLHAAKVKGDISASKFICANLVAEVKAITGVEGTTEFVFHPVRKWRFDVAFPAERIAVELNGYRSHSKRGRMEEDNVKLAAAVRLGWRVFYCTADQAKRQASLWVSELLAPSQHGGGL